MAVQLFSSASPLLQMHAMLQKPFQLLAVLRAVTSRLWRTTTWLHQ